MGGVSGILSKVWYGTVPHYFTHDSGAIRYGLGDINGDGYGDYFFDGDGSGPDGPHNTSEDVVYWRQEKLKAFS